MKPVLNALLVADHVYEDKLTNKKIVAGIFHNLLFVKHQPEQPKQSNAESLPDDEATISISPGGHRAGSPFCYISLTDVHGKQDFELRYVSLSDDVGYFKGGFSVDCQNPLETLEVVLPLPTLPAFKAGTFALELIWNNEPLGYHRITVIEMRDKDGSNSDGN